jgi:hypothetical protein
MLDLNSPRWSELTHAYGNAADIPDLLRQVETAPPQDNYKSEPSFSIWSALCHQGDVYTATYAAMPHIVAIAKIKSGRERFDCLSFVGYAEVSASEASATHPVRLAGRLLCGVRRSCGKFSLKPN